MYIYIHIYIYIIYTYILCFSSCRTSAYPQVPHFQRQIAVTSRLNRPGGQSRSKRIRCGRRWRCDWGQGATNREV